MKKLIFALITLSMIWGMSFLFIKVLVHDLGSVGVVFWRCFVGALTLWCIVLLKRSFVLKEFKKLPWKIIIIVTIFNNVLPWILIAVSETKISSSLASVINATTPIWTLIIGIFFFRIKSTIQKWIGLMVGFSGILFLLEFNITSILKENLIGIGTMLLATICYGLAGHIAQKRLHNISVMMLSVTTLTMASLISFICLLFTSSIETFMNIFQMHVILSLIGLGVFGSGIAYLLYYYLVKEGSAEFASFVTYIVPMTAIIWGFILLKESISFNMIIGLILVLMGVYLSTYKMKKLENEKKVTA